MKKRIFVFLCLVCAIMLAGCKRTEKQEGEMYVYYINAEGNALVQEICPVMGIEQTLEKLRTPSNATNGHSALPEDVKVESYSLANGQLELRFNESYRTMKKSTEILLRAAVVQTLVQVENVDFVMFYIGQEPLKDNAGNAIGLMQAENFVQNTGYTVNTYQTTNLKLYFSSADGMKLQENNKNNVHYSINTSIEKLVVEQLLKGNTSGGAQPTIPKTTKLLGLSVKDGICYVNFDSKFSLDGYDQNPEVTIYSIVNSIIENGNVSKVQILIDGSSDVLYKGSVNLSAPLEWNASIIGE